VGGPKDTAVARVRILTGIPGLDELLRGGLWRAGIYIVVGSPGSGKTILANQICYHHVRGGGRAAYITLLSETHARMLAQMEVMSFFDRSAVGTSLHYLNAFSAIESGGLAGLLELVRRVVRDHRADLLVIDGMITAGLMSASRVEYKKFLNELQTWVGVIGCTVLFLSSGGPKGADRPEDTMVDGLLELRTVTPAMRAIRQLRIAKFRGSPFTEGHHHYLITGDGVRVYPRFEAHAAPAGPRRSGEHLVSVGIPRLDEMLGGGVREGSITLVLGSSGAGKTTLGLQFLAAGAARGERGLHFGFYESEDDVRDKGDRFGLDLSGLVQHGDLEIAWRSPAEGILDVVAAELLERVRGRGVRRLFVDGLVGFKEAAYPERVPGFFSALSHDLAGRGVTTLITEETQELYIQRVEVPTPGVSAIFQNIVFVRQVETGSELERLISVVKARDTAHERSLRRFDIRRDGIHIGDRFRGSDAAMTGTARKPSGRLRGGPRRKR
jgi:circadian clock protein KaiC